MAPPKRALAAAAAPPVIDPADRLSSLPDEILAQILSFLPVQEAVRTCVLARAWRDVWKFTRRLLITGGTVEELQDFVDRLLGLRLDGLKCAPLDECEIMVPMLELDEPQVCYTVNHWIRTSLKCRVQTLRVQNEDEDEGIDAFQMSNWPLISPHLTRLELTSLWFDCRFLELDGCPVLEHLEINRCTFACVRKIMSPSLKRLVITECDFNKSYLLFTISAPCLISLWLEIGAFRAPLLESMPELVEAHVRIDKNWFGECYCDDPMGCYHVMQPGYISDGDIYSDDYSESDEFPEDYPQRNTEGSMLLEGLAQAKHLVLLAHHSRYTFRRDLRMCPTFFNLKTLVLNGYWCEPADCRALTCILEHAPVLENLAIIFSEKVELEYDIVLEGCPDAKAKSTMKTQCLKTVKVKCNTIHGGVQNALKFLSTLNICLYTEVDKEQLVEGANLMLKLAKGLLADQHTRHGGNLQLTDGEPQDPEEDAL